MESLIRVVVQTDGKRIDVSDVVGNVQVTDGLDATPTATFTLPLHRDVSPSSRIAYLDLFTPGDFVTIEGLAITEDGPGDWVTLLDGPITGLAQMDGIMGDRYQFSTTVMASSTAYILETDSVAWWMWLGSSVGVLKTRAFMTPDELNDFPARIAFNFMTRMFANVSHWGAGGKPAGERLGLALDGLRAGAVFEHSLTNAEGPFFGIVKELTDEPLHELFALTLPQAPLDERRGADSTRRAASSPQGEDGGATTLVMRPAPYPWADANGNTVLADWQALPLTRLEGALSVVGEVQARRNLTGVRNYVSVYPAFQWADEMFSYALGTAVENRSAQVRAGYKPLKVRTRLVGGLEGRSQESVEAFTRTLSWRVAAQYNHMDRAMMASVSIPFAPGVRPGERVSLPVPLAGGPVHEFHVRSRSLSWNPSQGGSTTLQLERGFEARLYADAAYWVSGLTVAKSQWGEYAANFRAQDTPGN